MAKPWQTKGPYWTRQRLLVMLICFWEQHDRWPGYDDFLPLARPMYLPCHATVWAEFGTIHAACQEAERMRTSCACPH